MSERKKADRRVIIHGDCWPVVSTVKYVVETLLPDGQCECTYEITELLQKLVRYPDALLLLCLRPRQHIFLFYALKNELLCHPILVVSDELLFSDQVVLHCWGDIPAFLHTELAGILYHLRGSKVPHTSENGLISFLSDPKPAFGNFAVPLIFNNPKRLMNYMSVLMYRVTESRGVTPDQQKLLKEIYRGRHRFSELKKKLNRSEKKIYQDKNRLLIKLGMKNRLHELLYGTRFCMTDQRTEFMSPDKTKTLFKAETFAVLDERK
ncbi:transcriptional regulator [Salmonella enterica subsp. enterica serovar Newport]|nr:transcriptional regulator [Salmonella enterica]EJO9588244.1 transcriptional regulator [Salmonella enterica]EKQ9811899.1 transcriptional regulator [Salmonella enterica subsp. enterica serovar Newport]